MIVVGIAARCGTNLDAGGSSQNIFKRTSTNLHGTLTATTAEAIDAICGGTEGRVEVELIDGTTGGRAEPEALNSTAVDVQSGFHGTEVQRTILHAVVQGDGTTGAA